MNNIKAIFLLAGGRSSGQRGFSLLLQEVFRESSKPSPTIAYIGAASEDDASFFKFLEGTFIRSGAAKVNHAITSPPSADIARARDIVNSADIVFISGGDVERGMDILNEKKLVDFLRQEYQKGKIFFGLSAGSIMLGQEWVRWTNPEDDNSAELFPCLGLAPVLCDTHAEKDNWQELKAALKLKNDGDLGYGIPTGSALKVHPGGKVEAMGSAVKRCVNHLGQQSGKVRVYCSELKPQ
jgi:peptidase E